MLAWILNLDFAATEVAAATPAPAAEQRLGGSSRVKRRPRYPRRIIIDGEVHWVQSADHERRLLVAYRRSLLRQRAELDSALPDGQQGPAVRQIEIKIRRTERRIDEAEERRQLWLARLRAEDEELLAMLH